jgi:hypothetical protein
MAWSESDGSQPAIFAAGGGGMKIKRSFVPMLATSNEEVYGKGTREELPTERRNIN